MRAAIITSSIIAGASAAIIPRSDCCFSLTASGGVSGTVGQLPDGQNRIGGGYPAAQYCISSSGGITDSSGRGCILTPPTTQFQCDTGATAQTGFSVSSSGELDFHGGGTFYACPVNNNGEYNIYTSPVPGQQGCVRIELSTEGKCAAPAPSSSAAPPPSSSQAPRPITTSAAPPPPPPPSSKTPPPPPPPPSSSAPSSTKSSSCPTSLSPGASQTPHLIVPVNKQSPNTAYGTVYSPSINSENSTIFNFDIPQSFQGHTCTLLFLFPEQSQLQTSSFTISGSGGLVFTQLDKTATTATTYATVGSGHQIGQIDNVSPGNSYAIQTSQCPAGSAISVEVSATGSLNLSFFEDYNPSPIGVFINSC